MPVVIPKLLAPKRAIVERPRRYICLALAIISAWLLATPAFADDVGSNAEQPLVVLGMSPVSEKSYETILSILLEDAVKSRLEDGIISWDLFQPEDGKKDLLAVERYKNRAAFERHLEAPYVKAFLEHIPAAVRDGEEQAAIFMKDLLPTTTRPISSPQRTKNIISALSVKNKSVHPVVKALLDVANVARSEDGNLIYDVYQDISDPCRLVVFQRWESSQAYDAHRRQTSQVKLANLLKRSLTEPQAEIWRAVRDIGR